jgi:hypothetical protein
MTASWWVMPRYHDSEAQSQSQRRWRVENYPATQFHSRHEAEQYAAICRVAGLVTKIVPSAEVLDERAYREYRTDIHKLGSQDN